MNINVSWQIAGAFAFGLILGWNVYFANRYRKGDISFGDIATLVGVVGGAAVLALFPSGSEMFGAYGVGLGLGFFAYFISLLILVRISPNFDADWFLDGRRKNPPDGYGYGTDTRATLAPMAPNPVALAPAPNVAVNFHGVNPGEGAMLSPGPAQRALSAPNPNATNIQQVCADTWQRSGPHGAFKNACNFFLVEVADNLGISLAGTADQIIDQIRKSGSWTSLDDGKAARDAAAQGKFVVAGVKSDVYSPPRTEGHVAIVTAGPMNPGGWAPAGYWGSTDPKIAALGGTGAPISNCFTAAVKDQIVYRCCDI